MFSVGSIAPVHDVAPLIQRNDPRDGTGAPPTAQGGTQNPNAADASSKAKPGAGNAYQLGHKRLTPDQERLVQELAQTDEKVRAHEAAHQAAAGSRGGVVTFTYQTGPDGKSYAVGGEVPVDMSSGRTPEETLAIAEQIRAAALAPADPSPQDLSVAAQASQMEAAAREQIMQQRLAAQSETAGRAGATPVLGPQALRGEDVSRSRSDAGSQTTAAGRSGAVTDSDSSGGQDAVSAGSPDASVPDAGAQASAALASLESERAAAGLSSVQVQQLARLAMAAYGL
jgi:hypothetical protein